MAGDAFLPTMLQTSSPDARPGAVIAGRYRVIEPIGAGGMGRVYRAQQLGKVERMVAVKVLYSSLESNILALQRFENEARIVGLLRHPNTVRIVDAGRTDDGRLFLITELLTGTRLDRLLADRRLSALEVVRMLAQICGSLSEAHQQRIVHRDLKPANVFIEKIGSEEVVKVLDFGVAKLLDEPSITRAMTIVGTPGFMSPEQGQGKPVDGRSDLFALGAIAYEALAGQPPHVAEGKVALLVLSMSERPRELSALVDPKKVPPELSALVMRMLEHDPELRPASADAVRVELDRMLPLTIEDDEVTAPPASRRAKLRDDTTELNAPAPEVERVSTSTMVLLLVPLLLVAIAAFLYFR